MKIPALSNNSLDIINPGLRKFSNPRFFNSFSAFISKSFNRSLIYNSNLLCCESYSIRNASIINANTTFNTSKTHIQ
ncbi:hypothetical protein KSF78_0000725 [Schistosoma japonicum]|nr:hypothetical protein KSF78_0000725 [Schistosoma japonicum]